MKIKILYAIPKLERAGTEQHLLNLVENLDKNRFEITICCTKSLGTLGESFLNRGGNIVCFNRTNIYDPRLFFDFYKLIKKYKFDIVHIYLFGFHYIAAIPAKILGVSLTISTRRELASWRKVHHHLLERLGNLFSDKIVACSGAAKKYTIEQEHVNSKKIVTIYNGISQEKFYFMPKSQRFLSELSLNNHELLIGMVANFSEEKDHYTLLNALNMIKNEINFKCLLIGKGPTILKIKKYSEKIGLSNCVLFLGSREDILELLSIIDIFVLTSLTEGLPNVILEALVCEKAVIATNVGGIPEVIRHKINGILIPPRSPEILATQIKYLANNPEFRAQLGKKGKETIMEKFNLKKMVNEYTNFYVNSVKNKNYFN